MSKAKLDRKCVSGFAPKGYIAVIDKSEDGCVGCAFETSRECGLDRKCASSERPDEMNVIFVKKINRKKGE